MSASKSRRSCTKKVVLGWRIEKIHSFVKFTDSGMIGVGLGEKNIVQLAIFNSNYSVFCRV